MNFSVISFKEDSLLGICSSGGGEKVSSMAMSVGSGAVVIVMVSGVFAAAT